jgi:NADH-quinone oxidoreductase subunit N
MNQILSIDFINSFVVEITTLCIALLSVVFASFVKNEGLKKNLFTIFSILSIALIAAIICYKHYDSTAYYDGMFLSYKKLRFAKGLMLGFLSLFVITCFYKKNYSFSIFALTLLCFIGGCFMLSATSFLSLYLSLELQAIPVYFIAASGIKITNKDGFEGVLKYFIISALLSCLMLYGISLIYFNYGQLDFSEITAAAMINISSINSGANVSGGSMELSSIIYAIANKPSVVFGFCLILFALFGKLSLAPFHFWAPDLYSSVKKNNLFFIASLPKVALLVALAEVLRLIYVVVGQDAAQTIDLVCLAAIGLSFTFGSFGGIRQANIKRLLAYSGILNAGFLVLAVFTSVKSSEGFEILTPLIYLTFYGLGIFSVLSLLSVAEVKSRCKYKTLESLNGLGKTYPLLSFLILCSIFSTIGIPPFAGFITKFAVLYSAISTGFLTIAVCGVVASVIACFYYLKILHHMYFKDALNPNHTKPHCSLAAKLIISLNIAILVANVSLIFVMPKISGLM